MKLSNKMANLKKKYHFWEIIKNIITLLLNPWIRNSWSNHL